MSGLSDERRHEIAQMLRLFRPDPDNNLEGRDHLKRACAWGDAGLQCVEDGRFEAAAYCLSRVLMAHVLDQGRELWSLRHKTHLYDELNRAEKAHQELNEFIRSETGRFYQRRQQDNPADRTLEKEIRRLCRRTDAWGEPLKPKELWDELYSALDEAQLRPVEVVANSSRDSEIFYGPEADRRPITKGAFEQRVREYRKSG